MFPERSRSLRYCFLPALPLWQAGGRLTHNVDKSLYAGIIYTGRLPTEAIAQAGVYNSATETNPQGG